MKQTTMPSHSQESLSVFLASPTQTLGLIGQPGTGKGYIAHQLAKNLLGSHLNERTLMVIKPVNQTISIDTIRSINRFLALVQPGTEQIRRVLIIEDADRMTDEAQNALLKAIEEPPEDTVCILTFRHERSLLPTILSRLQRITVQSLTFSEAKLLFSDSGDEKLKRAYHLSGGGMGLLYALMNDDQHPLLDSTKTAKQILAATTFERLAMIDELAKNKDNLPDIFFGLKRIAFIAARATNPARYTEISNAILRAEDAFAASVQVKLLLLDLFLTL